MMLPFVAGLLLAYGGMVGLCQGMERNFKLVWKREPSPVLRHALRMTGAALLVGSFASCVWAWGGRWGQSVGSERSRWRHSCWHGCCHIRRDLPWSFL